MITILISIKPEFVNLIMDGRKKFEFRKVTAQKKPDKMLIYSTAPVSKIIGEADIADVIADEVDKLWNLTKDFAGITKDFFDEYYESHEVGIAYRLTNVQKFPEPRLLKDYGIKNAPQSFVYIKD